MQHLDLGLNDLEAEGAIPLATTLTEGSTLRHLNLRDNLLGPVRGGLGALFCFGFQKGSERSGSVF